MNRKSVLVNICLIKLIRFFYLNAFHKLSRTVLHLLLNINKERFRSVQLKFLAANLVFIHLKKTTDEKFCKVCVLLLHIFNCIKKLKNQYQLIIFIAYDW